MWDLQAIEIIGLSESSVVNVGDDSYRVSRLRSLLLQGLQNCWAPLRDCLSQHHAIALTRQEEPGPLPCEILVPGTPGWCKGKVQMRVVLEFIPDQPPPPQNPQIQFREQSLHQDDDLFESLTRQM